MLTGEDSAAARDEIIIEAVSMLIDSGRGTRVPVMLSEICRCGENTDAVMDVICRYICPEVLAEKRNT